MPKEFKRNGFVTLEQLVVFMKISYCLSALFWMMFTVLWIYDYGLHKARLMS